MDISFIIVSWNAKKYLLECLESIESSSGGYKKEIIVVDNGSSDGSPEAVRKLFPHVKTVLNAANLGFARANNIGIEKSSGRYLCLINSDIKLLKDCVPRLIDFMEAHPEAGMAGPMVLNPDLTLQRTCRKFPTLLRSFLTAIGLDAIYKDLAFFPHKGIEEVDILSGCFLMVRRKALEEAGLLDERFFFYAEDKDWCKRFRDCGWKVVYFPEALAIHYGGGSSANAPVRFYIEMYRANLKYWEKHHGRSSKYVFVLITILYQIIRILKGCLLLVLIPARRGVNLHKINRSAACISSLLYPRGGTGGKADKEAGVKT
ncbi:MAG: glycosyltransferase family 2 protein [Deltaproteobacteria bacterium]|nr:glycosyltransferase family 2 protein [Deltaproteobacteria bacterium]